VSQSVIARQWYFPTPQLLFRLRFVTCIAITARTLIRNTTDMKKRFFLLALCAFTLLGLPSARAIEFYLDVFSHTQEGTISYGIDVYIYSSEGDYDELIDGYIVTSPSGDLVLFISIDSLSAVEGILLPDFRSMTDAINGQWTVEGTAIGFPIENYSFDVDASGLEESDLPPVNILYPTASSQGVTSSPTITFTAVPDAADIGIGLYPPTGSYPNDGFNFVTGDTTMFVPPFPLNAGANFLFLIAYLNNDSDPILATDVPELSWSSIVSLTSRAFSDFTVGGAELRLSAPERVGNQFRWSFDTEAGRTYDVQYKDNFNNAAWLPLQTITGDGSPKSFSVSPIQGARFFQVLRR